MNIMVFQYIHDWLLLARDRDALGTATLRFANLCKDLGILVNFDKSELLPTQPLVYLGFD